jgi:hypothetical protein
MHAMNPQVDGTFSARRYTLACKVAEAQNAELAATFKNRSVPDSEYFQDQLVNHPPVNQ